MSDVKSRIGNMTLLYGSIDGAFPHHCMVGPQWVRVLCMYLFLLVSTVLFINNIAVIWDIPVIVLASVFLASTIWFYTVVSCSNPGIILPPNDVVDCEATPTALQCCSRSATRVAISSPTDNSQDIDLAVITSDKVATVHIPVPPRRTQEMIYCGQCQFDRPSTAKHCTICGVCIDKLDHHCPWSGKCIGANTKLSFDRFIASVSILLLFVLLMVVVTLMHGHYIFHFTDEQRQRAED